jgi:hypothetical protein
MVDEGDENRLHQPADSGRGTLAQEEQVNRLAERQPAHDRVQRVTANKNVIAGNAG